MDHVAMRFWIKRQDHLIHDYSLAGYLLSPNVTIVAHAYANRSTMHNDVVVHLIKKLIVNPMLVGDEKSLHLSKDIKTFWNEYDDFVNMHGVFLINTCGTQLGVIMSGVPMASEIFPARDEGIRKASMFNSIQNLGHWNCRAKLEASQVD